MRVRLSLFGSLAVVLSVLFCGCNKAPQPATGTSAVKGELPAQVAVLRTRKELQRCPFALRAIQGVLPYYRADHDGELPDSVELLSTGQRRDGGPYVNAGVLGACERIVLEPGDGAPENVVVRGQPKGAQSDSCTITVTANLGAEPSFQGDCGELDPAEPPVLQPGKVVSAPKGETPAVRALVDAVRKDPAPWLQRWCLQREGAALTLSQVEALENPQAGEDAPVRLRLKGHCDVQTFPLMGLIPQETPVLGVVFDEEELYLSRTEEGNTVLVFQETVTPTITDSAQWLSFWQVLGCVSWMGYQREKAMAFESATGEFPRTQEDLLKGPPDDPSNPPDPVLAKQCGQWAYVPHENGADFLLTASPRGAFGDSCTLYLFWDGQVLPMGRCLALSNLLRRAVSDQRLPQPGEILALVDGLSQQLPPGAEDVLQDIQVVTSFLQESQREADLTGAVQACAVAVHRVADGLRAYHEEQGHYTDRLGDLSGGEDGAAALLEESCGEWSLALTEGGACYSMSATPKGEVGETCTLSAGCTGYHFDGDCPGL